MSPSLPWTEEELAKVPRIRFTRRIFDLMDADGFFDEERCELIDGHLYVTSNISPQRADGIQAIATVLRQLFGVHSVREHALVEVSAADREYNLPEADVALSRGGGNGNTRTGVTFLPPFGFAIARSSGNGNERRRCMRGPA